MDRVNAATRSRIMRAIRGRDTKPELAMVAALEQHRVAFTREPRIGGLRARPDFLVARVVVFVHGCFFHCCPKHGKPPASEGWRRKLQANVRRDRRVRRQLRAMGYRTMVVWEHEDMVKAAARVARRVLRESEL